MSAHDQTIAASVLRSIGATIVGASIALGLIALGAPALRAPYLGVICALVAFTYWLVQGFIILAIWRLRGLVPKKGSAPIYRAVRKYTSSLRGVRLALSIAILLLGILFFVFAVLFRPELALAANAWGGYAIAIWLGGLGIIWCAACIPKNSSGHTKSRAISNAVDSSEARKSAG